MVVISLVKSEVFSLMFAIKNAPDYIGIGTEYGLLSVLNKFKKAMKSRLDKKLIQNDIDIFEKKYDITTITNIRKVVKHEMGR